LIFEKNQLFIHLDEKRRRKKPEKENKESFSIIVFLILQTRRFWNEITLKEEKKQQILFI
jgi:hypothetical protein